MAGKILARYLGRWKKIQRLLRFFFFTSRRVYTLLSLSLTESRVRIVRARCPSFSPFTRCNDQRGLRDNTGAWHTSGARVYTAKSATELCRPFLRNLRFLFVYTAYGVRRDPDRRARPDAIALCTLSRLYQFTAEG